MDTILTFFLTFNILGVPLEMDTVNMSHIVYIFEKEYPQHIFYYPEKRMIIKNEKEDKIEYIDISE